MYVINANQYRSSSSYNQRVRFLILHYTALNFAASTEALSGKSAGVSAHYLVPDPEDSTYSQKSLEIFNLVDEKDRAWHAGVSAWEDRQNLNDCSIGIEIVYEPAERVSGLHFPCYNAKQIEAVTSLCLNILQRYPDITPTRVLGHSDIAYQRKQDPGPLFPWEKLYQSGIGAWYDAERKAYYAQQFTEKGLPGQLEMIGQFKKYGYGVEEQITQKNFSALVRAFQMHFRPAQYTGVLDAETCAILYSLCEKYKT